MAAPRKVRTEAEVVVKPIDPYRHYELVCRWRGPILGVVPRRSTQVDHIAKLLEDEMAKLARETRRRRPSQATVPPSGNGSESEGEEAESAVALTQRQQYLEEALRDPNLDDDAKQVITEALRELTPAETITKAVLRMTNTFPVGRSGNFVVPAKWFYGGLKLAVRHDLNVYPDQARELVRGCVSLETEEIDLGIAKPDRTVEANVPLPSSRPGEAQATIKRFHLVDPEKHGTREFRIAVKVLDSSFAAEVDKNIQRLFMVVGSCGLGGDRPNYGTFDVVSCTQVEK